ncbi:MAG TPA: type III secretion HpaP family protein [Fibrobacteria bacterium]|nr:type III secretion HpaP family protein [Fibrobacteria bacterium]
MSLHDSCGRIRGADSITDFKPEPPPQPTPEQVAAFRAQITEQATEKQAAHDRDSQDLRIIRAMELRQHNLHVLFRDDLAILEANVKGPEAVDQVRGRTVLTIDINMTAVPNNPITIWERPNVIETNGECVDIHLDGHAPRPGQLGYDPARPGRVHLEFEVNSLEEVPILAFHKTEGAVFSLMPFREIELPPLDPAVDIPQILMVPAADKGQQTAGYDTRQEAGAGPGTTIPTPTGPFPTVVVPGEGVRLSAVPTDAAPMVGAPTVGAPTVGVPTVGAPTVGAPTVGAPIVEVPKVVAFTAASSSVEAPSGIAFAKTSTTEDVSFRSPSPTMIPPEAGTRIRPFFQSHARFTTGPVGDITPVQLHQNIPSREITAFPPVAGLSHASSVRGEGGSSPFEPPIRLSAEGISGPENPGKPDPKVSLDLRVEASEAPDIPVILSVDHKEGHKADHKPARPVEASDTGVVPGVPAAGAGDGIVHRVEPARPEERAWALAPGPVPLEPRALLSLRDPEVRSVTDVTGKRPEKRGTGRGSDEEESKNAIEQNPLIAAGMFYPVGKEAALFNVPSGAAEPVRDRVGSETLAREVVDMVDRFLVTAEEGSYVKELRMTMNPDVMPGTEILMRMVGQSLTVTFVSKDGNMGKQLASEVPALVASLRAHVGGNVEIRILTGEEGVDP